jgi:hypothetical protein
MNSFPGDENRYQFRRVIEGTGEAHRSGTQVVNRIQKGTDLNTRYAAHVPRAALVAEAYNYDCAGSHEENRSVGFHGCLFHSPADAHARFGGHTRDPARRARDWIHHDGQHQ